MIPPSFDYHAPMTYGAGEPGGVTPAQFRAHVRLIRLETAAARNDRPA